MSSRTDELPADHLIQQLLEARRNLDELKNRQFTSGRSGVLGYMTQTSDTWDWSGTVTTGQPEWEVDWTGSGSQRDPIVNVFADVFHSSPDEANRITSAFNFWSSGGNSVVLFGEFLRADTALAGDPYAYKWTISLDITGTVPIYIKAYVVGSSPGTVTLTKVA